MRKSLFVILMLSVSGIFAQSSSKATMSEIVQQDDKLILNFTTDHWTDLPSGIEAKSLRSRGFSFLLMSDHMNAKGNAGIGFGLGFMSQNVHTDATIIDTGSAAYLSHIPDSVDLDLNKLSTNFITAALELRLRSNENQKGGRFKLSLGLLAGYLVQSHTKYEDEMGKYKTYHVDHLNKWQYGVTGRLGYKHVALYGYYSLAEVFENGEGPAMTPYSIGIAITM